MHEQIVKILESHGVRVLSRGKTGKEWEVVAIETGLSKNRTFYTEQVLKEALPLFEGVRVFLYKVGESFDHIPSMAKKSMPGGAVGNLVGTLENPRYGTFSKDGKKGEGILATFKVFESLTWLHGLLKDAFQSGKDLLGFSIDGDGTAEIVEMNGVSVKKIRSIESLDSVDLVTEPSAGGRLQRIAASQTFEGGAVMLDLIQKIKEAFPWWLADQDMESITEENAAERMLAIVESNRVKACEELYETMTPELQKAQAVKGFDWDAEANSSVNAQRIKHQEVSNGLMTLQSIHDLLADGKTEEAMKMIKDWMERLMSAERRTESQEKKSYAYPFSVTEPAPAAPAPAPTTTVPVKESTGGNGMDKIALLEKQVAEMKTGITLDAMLKEAKLPDLAELRIRKLFVDRTPTAEQIQEAIKEEKDYIGHFMQTDPKGGSRPKAQVAITETELDKKRKAMFGMVAGEFKVDDVPCYVSLHESYRDVTGFVGTRIEYAAEIMRDMAMSLPGQPGGHEKAFARHHQILRETVQALPAALRETLQTTTWAELFGDSIRRALIKEFDDIEFNEWRRIVSDIVPLQDFRTNRRIRIGGFADLSTVPELGTYTELTEPGDEEITYAVEKRGNLFSVSLEAITNDDLGEVRKIPTRLGRAARRTLAKFVLKTNLSDNPVLDTDSIAIINSAHNNDQTAALSEASLIIAIQQMRKQLEFSSNERVNIMPKTLVVPIDLEDTAWELIESAVKVTSGEDSTVPSVIKGRFRLEILINPWQTDTTDWFLVADEKRNPTIEIGFLGGRQEPEIFIQDQPNIGSNLTSDKVTYKIRHIYGGDVLDFRTFAGSIVS